MKDNIYGVELHHFHDSSDNKSVVMPGSIEIRDFERILIKLQEKYCLNSADVWVKKVNENRLCNKDICLTFDDTIKTQFTIAKKILDDVGIKAFFYIYTGMFHANIPRLEIYRYFSAKYYSDFKQFFFDFGKALEFKLDKGFRELIKDFPEDYLAEFSFYSREDRQYRFIRDKVISENEYTSVMDALVESNVSIKELAADQLWMSPEQIRQLSDEGHFIGLHSVSHPLDLGQRSNKEQEHEYFTNCADLEKIVGESIETVSYPSGSYNGFTIKLMEEMGIKFGFKTAMGKGCYGLMDIPRIDAGELNKIRS